MYIYIYIYLEGASERKRRSGVDQSRVGQSKVDQSLEASNSIFDPAFRCACSNFSSNVFAAPRQRGSESILTARLEVGCVHYVLYVPYVLYVLHMLQVL